MNVDALGPPAVSLAGFRLWVHGRERPESTDPWDGNWLQVTAVCEAGLARVAAQGPIVLVGDLASWRQRVEQLQRGEAEQAVLEPLEPALRVSIVPKDSLGHLALTVHVTPDHVSQAHSFEFEIDRSFLAPLAAQLAAIEREYPERG